jgi:TolA-binding protein
MAESYNQAGMVAEARNGYEQFLKFFPESDFEQAVRFKLGTILFVDGDYMQAAVEFSTVLEEEAPEETRRASLFNLALCKKMIGDVEGATMALADYIEQYPSDDQAADAAYQLGDIFETAGKYAEAAKRYEQALKANPASELKVELYYRLGVCREELKDVDAAIALYEKAAASKLKSDAFRLTALVRCAALYEQKGDYKKAISAYRDLVKNAEDGELVTAAQERVAHLEAISK